MMEVRDKQKPTSIPQLHQKDGTIMRTTQKAYERRSFLCVKECCYNDPEVEKHHEPKGSLYDVFENDLNDKKFAVFSIDASKEAFNQNSVSSEQSDIAINFLAELYFRYIPRPPTVHDLNSILVELMGYGTHMWVSYACKDTVHEACDEFAKKIDITNKNPDKRMYECMKFIQEAMEKVNMSNTVKVSKSIEDFVKNNMLLADENGNTYFCIESGDVIFINSLSKDMYIKAKKIMILDHIMMYTDDIMDEHHPMIFSVLNQTKDILNKSRPIINAFFDNPLKPQNEIFMFFDQLVALNYITTALMGLNESELYEILLCKNDFSGSACRQLVEKSGMMHHTTNGYETFCSLFEKVCSKQTNVLGDISQNDIETTRVYISVAMCKRSQREIMRDLKILNASIGPMFKKSMPWGLTKIIVPIVRYNTLDRVMKQLVSRAPMKIKTRTGRSCSPFHISDLPEILVQHSIEEGKKDVLHKNIDFDTVVYPHELVQDFLRIKKQIASVRAGGIVLTDQNISFHVQCETHEKKEPVFTIFNPFTDLKTEKKGASFIYAETHEGMNNVLRTYLSSAYNGKITLNLIKENTVTSKHVDNAIFAFFYKNLSHADISELVEKDCKKVKN